MTYEAKRVLMTPGTAAVLLEQNTRNRMVSRREVERLKGEIAAGRWKFNAEAVKVSNTGILLDGQHRLTAIAEGDQPVELLLIEGLDDEVFTTLDQGRKRTGGDVLYTRGVQHHNAVASAAVLLYRIIRDQPTHGGMSPIPAYGIDEIVRRHPALVAMVQRVVPTHRQGDTNVVALGQLAAFAYLVEHVLGMSERAQTLVEGLAQGTGLEDGSPILNFRRRVFDARTKNHIAHAQAKIALLTKVVGLHVSGQHVKYLTPPASGSTFWALIPGLKQAVERLGPEEAMSDLSY